MNFNSDPARTFHRVLIFGLTAAFLILIFRISAGAGDIRSSAISFSAGIAANNAAAGLLAEARVFGHFGLRTMGAWIFGLGSRDGSYFFKKGEYLFGGIVSPSLYIPAPDPRIEPFIWAGSSWSYYHWERGPLSGKGDITDITWGGGAGCGYRASSRIRLEAVFWLNRDYKVNRFLGRKSKGHRLWLPMPFVSCSYIF